MQRQHRLVAAKVGRGNVLNQVDQLQALTARGALAALEIFLDQRPGLLAVQVFDGRSGDQDAAGNVLDVRQRLVEIGRKMMLGDIHRGRVGNDHVKIGRHGFHARHMGQRAGRFGIAGQPEQLLFDVGGLFDPVVLGHQPRRAGQQIQKRQLVGNRGQPMVLHKRQGQRAGKLPLALQKYLLVGHKHIVKDRQGFGHLEARADRMVEGVALGV